MIALGEFSFKAAQWGVFIEKNKALWRFHFGLCWGVLPISDYEARGAETRSGNEERTSVRDEGERHSNAVGKTVNAP
jgi:hypothetical protein